MLYTRSGDIPNKVITGEFPVGFLGSNRSACVAAKEGGEIKVTYAKEGEVLLANPFVILSKAPHPNAAKLLIDYMHSFEGQKLMVEMDDYHVGRKDVPYPPNILEFTPPISQINVIPMDWKSATQEEMDVARDEFKEIFKK